MQWQKDNYLITNDRNRVDIDTLERWLRASYWGAERPRSVIEASVANSVCFSLLEGDTPIGFARVVTDTVTFAWIADVVIDEAYRGRGLGTWLMACVMEHPSVANTSRQLLRTLDAHGLYEKLGFERAECMTRTL